MCCDTAERMLEKYIAKYVDLKVAHSHMDSQLTRERTINESLRNEMKRAAKEKEVDVTAILNADVVDQSTGLVVGRVESFDLNFMVVKIATWPGASRPANGCSECVFASSGLCRHPRRLGKEDQDVGEYISNAVSKPGAPVVVPPWCPLIEKSNR